MENKNESTFNEIQKKEIMEYLYFAKWHKQNEDGSWTITEHAGFEDEITITKCGGE